MKKVLIIAFDFPPCHSAGVQRSLRFAEFLPEFGWQPLVVTTTKDVHERRDDSLAIPDYVQNKLIRAKAVDATKKYAINGKYFQWMAIPDRYWPWYFDAIKQASKLIEKERPDAIWSTYPAMTTHLIAKKLHKKYKLPWIADYRDPLQCHYDKNAQGYASIKKWLEKGIIAHADKVVMTSEHAAEFYRGLFSQYDFEKFTAIENGFYQQEQSFSAKTNIEKNKKFTLLYSGMLYDDGRDPQSLFSALARLKAEQRISADNFVLNFRATKNNYAEHIKQLGIADLVSFLPSISYQQALEEMQQADVNLLIQDGIFNRQVPGKIYEYISALKPILALTPANSATSDVINKISFGFQAEGVSEIVEKITFLLSQNIDCSENIESFSRKSKTAELAQILNDLVEA